jgi:hypothetical protein
VQRPTMRFVPTRPRISSICKRCTGCESVG